MSMSFCDKQGKYSKIAHKSHIAMKSQENVNEEYNNWVRLL